jgi:ATP-dependent DNA ligase
VILCAFDLIELDGEGLRRTPIETRKRTLKSLLRGKHAGIVFNAHFITTARSFTAKLTRSAVRASYRNGSARPTALAGLTLD